MPRSSDHVSDRSQPRWAVHTERLRQASSDARCHRSRPSGQQGSTIGQLKHYLITAGDRMPSVVTLTGANRPALDRGSRITASGAL
ncbi:hypothetical protein SAMN05216188_14414 [Lentzea xinjiangensis]|uniref:Uncharacterized protein n=1 Tax=Lentzea xinjiangensis TaxID=402600 RepID=A0A1H9WUW4_9PSEU|nr:hypothetical protein SAMN05216188_14414 [Lentzea xinjiangensis]